MDRFIHLHPDQLPDQWFNILPHLPEPLPPPEDVIDGKGSRIAIMKKIRLRHLQEQDTCQETWVDIPGPVLEKYREIGRPTPLMRARRLEKYLETPARIYIKREDLSPTSSFKLNSSLAQAFFATREGAQGLVSETGAGQWGVALAYACNLFGLQCVVFWVKVSYEQKAHRAMYAKILGAEIVPSPSPTTAAGRQILKEDPGCYGSIGTSIGEAISFSMENEAYKYVSGSNLPHVLLHQTIIGLETRRQLESIGERPDVLVACVGGGSNLGGFMSPFLFDKRERGEDLRWVAAESDAAPRLTRGEYRYDHSDPVGLTPKSLSYTLGMDYMPPPTHVGGLRQHNGSPIIGSLKRGGLLEAYAYSQETAFDAGRTFVQCEGVLPAPETNHAIRATIDLALEAKKNREAKVIVMCFSGDGLLDIKGYQEVLKL